MKPKLKIVVGSTRPGRSGPVIARWVAEHAKQQECWDVELIDLAEVDLPLLDEPSHPARQDYLHDHTKRWSAKVDEADAFIFVTPEYDYFPPAALVNAMQYLFGEWARKPAGIVSYGGVSGGLRSTQVLRGLLSNLGMMALSRSVPIPFFAQHIEDGTFQPNDPMIEGLTGVLTDLHQWSEALGAMRAGHARA